MSEYIAETFANDDGILPPRTTDRATMRLFTELCGSSFSYFPILRAKGTDDAATQLQAFKDGLVGVDAFLQRHHGRYSGTEDGGGGPFLFGSRFSLAECNAAPFVQRSCVILPAFTGDDADDGGSVVDPLQICDELGLVRLQEWMEAVISRPSVVASSVSEKTMLESTSRLLERFGFVGNK